MLLITLYYHLVAHKTRIEPSPAPPGLLQYLKGKPEFIFHLIRNSIGCCQIIRIFMGVYDSGKQTHQQSANIFESGHTNRPHHYRGWSDYGSVPL